MFRPLPFAALLYTALAAFANPVAAGDLEALRVGDMKKFVVARDGQPVEGRFTRADGSETGFDEMRGQVLVVNFWATWCAPCKLEMPSLNALDAALEDEGLNVVAIASGRNTLPQIEAFNDEAGIDRLEVFLDPRSNVLRGAGAFGLPTTIVLDPEGREIGRLQGEADWASDEALALMREILAQSGV